MHPTHDKSTDRPAGPSAGRFFRSLTGVQENILAKVPGERSRYTAMGGVVLCTATLAAFSMAVGLYNILGGFKPLMLLVIPVWGWFILSFDRWLMSGSVGEGGARWWRVFLPRLLLAIVFGVIIAEPLLLGVFSTAIEERVAADRSTEVVSRQSDLRTCNPVPGTPEEGAPDARAPKCAGLRLAVPEDPKAGSPKAKAKQLAEIKEQAAQLRKTLDKDSPEYARLMTLARQECVGDSGPGLTGQRGQGPECLQLRAEAAKYHTDHHIDSSGLLLADLEDRTHDLAGQLSVAQAAYATHLDEKIKEEIAQVKDRQQEIGLLERWRTLDQLVSENAYVEKAQWGLRVFFILVEALPVLLKVLGGVTAYDRLASAQTSLQEDNNRISNMTESLAWELEHGTQRLREDARHQVTRVIIERARRNQIATVKEDRDLLIDAKERNLDEVMETAADPGNAGHVNDTPLPQPGAQSGPNERQRAKHAVFDSLKRLWRGTG